MMNEWICTLLSLSVSGTLLLLLIFGGKPFYKNKFSKRWQYGIWLIVAFRLLLPFTTETTVVGSLFEKLETTAVPNGYPEIPEALSTANTHAGDRAAAEPDEKTGAAVPRHTTLDGCDFVFLVWSAFALVLFTRKILICRKYIRYIEAGNTEVTDTDIVEILSACREKLHVKAEVGLYQNKEILSPLMTGFFHPSIILPVKKLTEKEAAYIFTHEIIHYKRRDLLYKWLIQTAVCVHWFNPFLYFLEKEVNRACELSCDEAVISLLGEKAKREYGDTLISFVKTERLYKNHLVSVTLTEGAEQLKERLGAIMSLKKKSGTVKVLTAFFTCVLCICSAAAGAYAAPVRPEEQQTAEEKIGEQKAAEQEISVIGDKTYQSAYTQEGYYWNSYIIELGWNLYDDMDKENTGRTEFQLEDGTAMTVYYADTVKEELADSEAAAAVNGLLSYLKKIHTDPEIETPLIVKISYTGDKDLTALREEYYQNGELCSFSALFSELDKTAQKEWCQKIYDADKIAFFASVIRYMEPELITSYAEKAEQDRKINFFSVMLDYMQPAAIRQYAEKYYQTDEIASFSVIAPYLTERERQEWLAKAQEDQKNVFSNVLTE